MSERNLLCICYDFVPKLSPTAIRASKLLNNLKQFWQIQIITSGTNAEPTNFIYYVKNSTPNYLLFWLHKLRLYKISNLLLWPDETIFWILPAVFQARKLAKQQQFSSIVVFMMPYGTGIVGVLLKWWTGLPLLLNFDDSYTCTDMNSSFGTWIHYKMSIWLEDFYVKQADAVIYVSQRNLEAVKNRHSKEDYSKFHLVRYGAEPKDFLKVVNDKKVDEIFRIIYIGAMVGWFEFYPSPKGYFAPKNILRWWNELGVYKLVKLDLRSHSPVFIGKAVKQAIAQNPELQGKIKVEVYGSTYPKSVTDLVLESQEIADVVQVQGSVPHTEAIQLACQSDLLFLTLPDRPDGSPGGRISAKTYEYLMTDKPILAAVPQGENWDYLHDKPGVWLVKPTDVSAMTKVVSELVAIKNSGKTLTFDRTELRPKLSYENLAREFNQVLEKIIELPSRESI